MASYLEVKKLLSEILGITPDIDEKSDIDLQMNWFYDRKYILPDSKLLEAFNEMQKYKKDQLEMRSDFYIEIAVRVSPNGSNDIWGVHKIRDEVNQITYELTPASTEYCMFLLNSIADSIKKKSADIPRELKNVKFLPMRNLIADNYLDDNFLPRILKAHTIKIKSDVALKPKELRDRVTSFRFHVMNTKDITILEYARVEDMYYAGIFRLDYSPNKLDSVPFQVYNADLIEYYTMGMESSDPFTKYISFYHVIEYNFDAVRRDTEEKSDGKAGKGNEFESLKSVLEKYVTIEELKNRIRSLDPSAIDYYETTFVPFTSSTQTKVAWSDLPGVYTNLAHRIYKTRNALVHSKSGQEKDKYKPYEHKEELRLELPLIRAVADLVIIKSTSEIL